MGDPVAGNPTQYMLEKAFDAARLDWRFLTFEVPPLEFEGALRGARIFGFHGVMLAPPHGHLFCRSRPALVRYNFQTGTCKGDF